jgi:hypothetical protein
VRGEHSSFGERRLDLQAEASPPQLWQAEQQRLCTEWLSKPSARRRLHVCSPIWVTQSLLSAGASGASTVLRCHAPPIEAGGTAVAEVCDLPRPCLRL